MSAFDQENFSLRLLAETLLYDQEYGVIGSLSLIDPDTEKERYIASFMPDDGTYLIEEATAWESDPPPMEDDADVAYALAVDSTIHEQYTVPEEAAVALLQLAEEHDLLPSFTMLFESEEL
jgi:hypothetical protein